MSESNGWVIVNRETGLAMLETYYRGIAEECGRAGYEVLTSYEWLCRYNSLPCHYCGATRNEIATCITEWPYGSSDDPICCEWDGDRFPTLTQL